MLSKMQKKRLKRNAVESRKPAMAEAQLPPTNSINLSGMLCVILVNMCWEMEVYGDDEGPAAAKP